MASFSDDSSCLGAGKVNKHLDAWDAIKNQEWFSIEGFRHVLSQMLTLQRVPDLDGPKYQIMKKLKTYEIRRCDFHTLSRTFIVAL